MAFPGRARKRGWKERGGMDAVYRVMAIAQLRDLLSGPLRSIKGHLGSAKASAAAFSASLARMAVVMAAVAGAAGAVMGVMVSLAMSTAETGKALGELSSVGIKDLKALEDKATEFSNTWAGFSKVGFIRSAYDIKSGIASLSDEGVIRFAELAGITAKATKALPEEMTPLFATGYGIFKQMYSEMSDLEFGEMFSAGIAASVQQFKTTGPGMRAAMENAGAAAANANVEFAEQLTILGMLQATMNHGEAGTRYKAFITAAAAAGKALNLQFLDANKQLRSMPEILGELKKKYGETIDQMEKMEIQKAFGTAEAVAVVDLLVNKTDELTNNIDALKAATGQGIEFTKKMAMTMNTDLGSSVDIMKQRWNNLIEIMGGAFTWSVRKVVWIISDLILEFQKLAKSWLSNPVGALLFKIAGGVAAVAAVLALLAVAGAAISFLWPILAAGLSAALGALGAVIWPILLVAVAVGILYAAWKTNFMGMRDTVTEWYRKVKLVFQAVTEIFQTLGKDGLGPTEGKVNSELAKQLDEAGLTETVQKVAKNIYRIKELFSGLWTGLEKSWDDIWAGMEPGIMSLVTALEPLEPIIRNVAIALTDAGEATDASTWRLLGEAIGKGLGKALATVALALSILIIGIVEVTRGFAGIAGSISAGDWEGAYKQLSELFEPVIVTARGAWEMFKEASVKAAQDAWTAIKESCKYTALGVWVSIKEGLANLGQKITDALKGAWEAAKNYLKSVTLEDVATLAFDGLVKTISAYTGLDENLVRDKIKQAWEAAKNYLGSISLSDIASNIFNGFVITVSAFTGLDKNVIKDKITGAWEAAKSYLGSISLSDIASNIFNGFVITVANITGLDPEVVKAQLKTYWDDIKTMLSNIDLAEIGREIIDSLADGVTNGAKNTYQRIKGVVTDLKDWITLKKKPEETETVVPDPVKVKSGMEKLKPLVTGPMSELQDEVRRFDVAGPVSEAVQGAETALQGLNWESHGQAAMSTFADGIRNASPLMKAAMTDAMSATKPLMPQSDAAEGPFSRLTASGASIPGTMAAGIRSNQGAIKDALRGAFAGLDYPELGGIPLPRDGEADADGTAGDRRGPIRAGDGRTIVIQSLTVSLPDVQDAEDFGRQLQRFVEQHDVEG